jgi:hypothetical protein
MASGLKPQIQTLHRATEHTLVVRLLEMVMRPLEEEQVSPKADNS